MPEDANDNDCHVINCVYSKQLGKWIWIDPTCDAYVMDENNNLLSIEEVRQRLIDNKPLKINDDANWNHESKETVDEYLYSYMAKNLYWMICATEYKFNTESSFHPTDTKYVALLPPGYEKNARKNWHYKTYDPSYFWQAPKE